MTVAFAGLSALALPLVLGRSPATSGRSAAGHSAVGPTLAPSFSAGDLRRPDGRVGLLVPPGRPTVVSFFASWCDPCRRGLPVLAAAARGAGGRGAFLGGAGPFWRARPRWGMLWPVQRGRRGRGAAPARSRHATAIPMSDPSASGRASGTPSVGCPRRPRSGRRPLAAVMALAATVVLASCSHTKLRQDALDPQGPVARKLHHLITPVF